MRATLLHSSMFLIFVAISLLSMLVQVHCRQINNDDSLKNRTIETTKRIKAAEVIWYARRPRHPLLTKKKTNKRGSNHDPETVRIVGSRLPDCTHACGSCSPCRLVMISFVCASLEEAETCPMAYKCMCNSKSYPVP